MDLLVLSVGILLSSGLISLVLGRYPRCVTLSGVAGTFTASLLGLIPSLRVFLTGSRELLRAAWEVPYGSFYLELDSLSAFFLILIFVLSLVVSIYAGQYLFAFRDKKSLGPPWFFFQLLIAGMAFVVVARNGVLFLVSWEIMSLAAFFLVTFEHEKEKVRDAGWTYLVAAHLGVMFLLALFILLGRESGSLDFDKFKATGDQGDASVLFLLAVVGFGSKAG